MAKKSYKPRSKSKGENFQDEAMEREFDKGFNKGANGRRRGNRNSRTGGAKYPVDAGSSKVNSPDWNAPTVQILKDANSLPFSHMVGRPYDIPLLSTQYPDSAIKPANIYRFYDPGIIKISLISSLGNPESLSAPVTTAGNALYSFVRHMNSGARNYDAPDMTLYTFCMGECLAFYSWMCRVYGYASHFQFYNRYVPKTLIETMGVDYDDLIANLADFRLLVNQFGYKLQSFCIPQGIEYVNRHQWLYRDVYTDADSTKAQLYLFNPLGFFVWSEGVEDGPGFAEYKPLLQPNTAVSYLTVEQIRQYAENMISPINGSEDFNMMSGDILKAFGASKIFKINPIDEKYMLSPIYSKEVLSEIENAMPAIARFAGPSPIQGRISHSPVINGGEIIEQVYFTCPSYQPPSGSTFSWNHPTAALENYIDISYQHQVREYILNMHMNDPQPADITVATNLKSVELVAVPSDTPSWYLSAGGTIPFQIANVRSEYCVQAEIIFQEKDGTSLNFAFSWDYPLLIGVSTQSGEPAVQPSTPASSYAITNTLDAFVSELGYLTMLTAFDWAPLVAPKIGVWGQWTSPTGGMNGSIKITQMQPLCDLDNITLIDKETLKDMHESALLGLLTCRDMPGFLIK